MCVEFCTFVDFDLHVLLCSTLFCPQSGGDLSGIVQDGRDFLSQHILYLFVQ